jgi:hypothetical protein
MDAFPTEEQIAIAVSAYAADVFCLSDVIRFLNINDYRKPNPVRVICWLVGLKLIPGDRVKWIPEITRLVTYYSRCVERYCDECRFTPLDSVPGPVGGLIRDTIRDSLPWFLRFGAALGLPPEALSDGELRVQRLFVVLSHDAHKFEYTSGYQYFGCVCYLLSLVLAVKGGLDHSFAEAIASHMARGFISIVAMTKHLDELHVTSDHVMELQKVVDYFCPAAQEQLRRANLDLFEFTLQ